MTYGVLTVCLNSAKTIKRTLDSVLSQSLPPDQYVIVDGGSTDGTMEIIHEAESRARKMGLRTTFTLLAQTTKGGITEAWNMGLGVFDPEIVFILNSDDYYEQNAAQDVIDVFERRDDAGIVLASGRYFREGYNDSIICHNRPFWTLPFAMAAIHPGCFVRKSVYQRVGLFDSRYRVSADYDFVYRCHKAGVKVAYLNKTIVNVQLGGYAETHKELARRETFEIASRHSSWPILGKAAYQTRRLLGR